MTSTASGWTVAAHPTLGWSWTAYGPRGARAGLEATPQAAEAAAIAAENHLRDHDVQPPTIGH
jgi:hypothetical protein